MLEAGAALRTWRLLERPLSGQRVRAELLGNHRLAYLDYEGPVSRNRGRVTRWDAGTFTCELDSADRVVVQLSGQRCSGHAVLERDAAGDWIFAIASGS